MAVVLSCVEELRICTDAAGQEEGAALQAALIIT